MPKINTPVVDFHTGSSDLFIPCTGAISTAEFRYVNFGVWLAGVFATSLVELEPAVQFSDDGVNWGTETALPLDATTAYATSPGWTFSTTSYYDFFNGSVVTPKLFCRFGAIARNHTGTSGTVTGQFGLLLDFKPVAAPRTWTFGPKRVFCKADHATNLYHDVSGPIPAANISELRATVEVLACTGSTMDMLVGIQTANNPNDPSEWSQQFTALNLLAVSSNGITFPERVLERHAHQALGPHRRAVRRNGLEQHHPGGRGQRPHRREVGHGGLPRHGPALA